MKYYFILIAILEADLHYNNNNNIVYNDTDDGLLNRRWIYIYIKGDNGGPSQVLPGLCNRQIMTMTGNWLIRFT